MHVQLPPRHPVAHRSSDLFMWAAILQCIAQHADLHIYSAFGVGELVVSYHGHCTSHPVRCGGGGGVRCACICVCVQVKDL